MGGPDDFDFWLGTWRATWGENGAHGTNTVTKEYGGRVIQERFDGRPGIDLAGMSVSVYDAQADCWRQNSSGRSRTSVPSARERRARPLARGRLQRHIDRGEEPPHLQDADAGKDLSKCHQDEGGGPGLTGRDRVVL